MWTPYKIAIRRRYESKKKSEIGIRLKNSHTLIEQWMHPDYPPKPDHYDYMEIVAQFRYEKDAIAYYEDQKYKIKFELDHQKESTIV